MDDMLAGRAPNTGRFCAHCYQPLGKDRDACPHCDLAVAERAPVAKVPTEVIEAHKVRRSREGTVVRSIAWGGLTLGVVLALVPLAFAGVKWWSITLFFGLMVFFYIASANLANSLGDAWGYNWGLAAFRKRWDKFVAQRDAA
jgi:hypothetical protein